MSTEDDFVCGWRAGLKAAQSMINQQIANSRRQRAHVGLLELARNEIVKMLDDAPLRAHESWEESRRDGAGE